MWSIVGHIVDIIGRFVLKQAFNEDTYNKLDIKASSRKSSQQQITFMDNHNQT
jgi:hypothetical protein